MSIQNTARAEDLSFLRILDLRDHEGMSFAEIGRAMGLSRSNIAGKLHRVNKDNRDVEDACRKKANRDGGMPRHWWRK